MKKIILVFTLILSVCFLGACSPTYDQNNHTKSIIQMRNTLNENDAEILDGCIVALTLSITKKAKYSRNDLHGLNSKQILKICKKEGYIRN